MNTAYILQLAAGTVLGLGLGMAFSALESAVLAVNRIRLLRLFSDEASDAKSEQEIFRDTKDIYALTRLGLCASVLLVGLCFFSLFADVYSRMLPAQRSFPAHGRNLVLAGLTSILLIAPFYLFFVYALPRFLGRRIAVASDAKLPAWVRQFMRILRPASALTRNVSRFWHGLFLPHYHLTKNEVVALVTHLDLDEDDVETQNDPDHPEVEEDEESEEETDEEEIIYNLLDLENTLVREVMKPINSVVAVRLEGATMSRIRNLSRRTGYSRFPVYHDRIVDLVGYVNVYDLLKCHGDDQDIEAFVQEPFFIPEFMRVSDLLAEFRQRGEHAAVVVDEYGGSSGWITREDVLEEIVGEIEDEFDPRRKQIFACEDGTYLVEGSTDIDDLAEELDLEILEPEPQYDTVAGYILMHLGRIPKEGDRVPLGSVWFIVERMRQNQIAQIRITFPTLLAEDTVED